MFCRYHIRSANPGAETTRREFWGYKGATKPLYLLSDLNSIIERLPAGTDITIDNLIWNHTMYPYVRPSLTKDRADFVYSMLVGADDVGNFTYQKAGLSGRRLALPLYLRFCPSCVKSDTARYGEAYWHRLHQLPGVQICPTHNEYIQDSDYSVRMIFRHFYPASLELCEKILTEKLFSDTAKMCHLAFAKDCAWILEHGAQLGTVEDMNKKHLQLLEARGYLEIKQASMECDYKTLNRAIQKFFGQEFLESIAAYDENDFSSWPAMFIRKTKSNPQTAEHLLMMRFLAGSPKNFTAPMTLPEKPLPFGEPPWPCRNKVCEYYLTDCIENIDITMKSNQPKAVFTCPHCGFSYRRGRVTPKEMQYSGQVHLVDFGWLWRAKLKECLVDRKMRIQPTSKEMGCSYRVVLEYGVALGFLHENKLPKDRPPYKGRITKAPTPESKTSRRERWLCLVADNPNIKRSELSRMDLENYKWMLRNDYEWFDANTPSPVRSLVDWNSRDAEYLTKAKSAISEMLAQSGRPQWICYSSISNRIGLGNAIYGLVNKMPLTKQYFDSVIETKTEWRKRKIQWAIQQLKESRQPLSYDQVRLVSGISGRMAVLLREYILDEIKQLDSEERMI